MKWLIICKQFCTVGAIVACHCHSLLFDSFKFIQCLLLGILHGVWICEEEGRWEAILSSILNLYYSNPFKCLASVLYTVSLIEPLIHYLYIQFEWCGQLTTDIWERKWDMESGWHHHIKIQSEAWSRAWGFGWPNLSYEKDNRAVLVWLHSDLFGVNTQESFSSSE